MRYVFKLATWSLLTMIPFGFFSSAYSLPTDPMLQMQTSGAITVVWFTELPFAANYVEYGETFSKSVVAHTTRLSKMREDSTNGQGPIAKAIYRHEAVLTDLVEKTPYRVVSVDFSGNRVESNAFFCNPSPQKGRALKILFTSDHQGKPMVAANLQKVKEVEPNIDAVFFAGDCVDHADKASEWFGRNGFFACFQGSAQKEQHGTTYNGGAILQYAPMFCAIGNHEVMGRWNPAKSLDEQFNDPYPLGEKGFNCDSYQEIFTLPESSSGGKTYYAITYGDIRLVVLYATRIWRTPNFGLKGKYTEDPSTFAQLEKWGHGDFIFEPIQRGSPQYNWLEKELQSPEFKEAKYRIVMLHNPLHSLGENSIPPFTDPQQRIELDSKGEIQAIRYEYPRKEDYLIRDIEPLLEQSEVDLVLCGHSHVWNRFQSLQGMHHLETSNVGNSYGAYLDKKRALMPGGIGDENYVAMGDPNGLTPIVPTIAPLRSEDGAALPYISSNTITVFSIFSTDTGAVDSYYFDTEHPNSPTVHFDRFYLRQNRPIYQTATSIQEVKEYAQKSQLPDLVVFDIDNTLIESARQIALDPSTNGFLRKRFPENSEEIIRGIQSHVPWKLCESQAVEVVKFFQSQGVQVIGVTKRSPLIRGSVYSQLLENGIDFRLNALLVEDAFYENGILYAQSDKGTALKRLLEKAHWNWRDQTIYFVDDRKSHLEDYHKAFLSEINMVAFEYTYSHSQQVDISILTRQLEDFLSGLPIQEDAVYH